MEFQRVHPGLLKEIIVRPILPGERWEELMRRHHHLGFSRLVGESLRYVAERAGEWFAPEGCIALGAGAQEGMGPWERWDSAARAVLDGPLGTA